MWLISYPRSGNSWLRLFFETYTGQPSRSLVGADGFLIHERGVACVWKLHYFNHKHIKLNRGDKAIVLLRNPLDAFMSNLKYKGVKKMEDKFIDKMWGNYETVIRGFQEYPNDKILIYYEDLLTDFETAVIPALELMELEIDHNKIKNFISENTENYKTVTRWFKRFTKKKRLSEDMNFTDRRNQLSERHVRLIKNKIEASPYSNFVERYL